MSSDSHEIRLDRLGLAFGLGKTVDMTELGCLIAELHAGTDLYLEAQLLHSRVLFGQDRFADCVAVLEHVLSIYPTSDEARLELPSALMHRAFADVRAILAKVDPEKLDADYRSEYWEQALYTEMAAWDRAALSAVVDRIPTRDRRNPSVRAVLLGARHVLSFFRSKRPSRSKSKKRKKR